MRVAARRGASLHGGTDRKRAVGRPYALHVESRRDPFAGGRGAHRLDLLRPAPARCGAGGRGGRRRHCGRRSLHVRLRALLEVGRRPPRGQQRRGHPACEGAARNPLRDGARRRGRAARRALQTHPDELYVARLPRRRLRPRHGARRRSRGGRARGQRTRNGRAGRRSAGGRHALVGDRADRRRMRRRAATIRSWASRAGRSTSSTGRTRRPWSVSTASPTLRRATA